MPKFDNAGEVECLCVQARDADQPRSKKRALINEQFNGYPPHTQKDVEANGIKVNVPTLTGVRLAHDARSQFYGAFLKPGKYFTATTDIGAKHRRSFYNATVTDEISKIMKGSIDYYETFRSKLDLLVIHGIGPAVWRNGDLWCPKGIGIEDVFVPSNSFLPLHDIPHIIFYRSFSAQDLIESIRGPNVDPGWNEPLVEECIDWIDSEIQKSMRGQWPELWSPEKSGERAKGDGSCYAGDAAPKINVFDMWFRSDEKDNDGWRRRMVLDTWNSSDAGRLATRKQGSLYQNKNQFLYNSKDRKCADKLSEFVSFQFADLSAVAPFRYSNIRSLGWLLYSLCHLQDLMHCRVSEAVFEATMMYLRVKNSSDVENAMKLEMVNRGFIDESISFVPAAERFQVNQALVQMGLMENQRLIQDSASSYTANKNLGQQGPEKTKFQVMAEVNSMTALVQAALLQAYHYQKFEYVEIFRRFMKADSSDPDVRRCRANILRKGVPEKILTPEAWNIEPERVMGSGNKTLELTIAQQLMEWRNLYDPDSQRIILRNSTAAFTDDYALAQVLVPEQQNQVTDSVHDAEMSAASLLRGLPMGLKQGVNHVEYASSLLKAMQSQVGLISQRDNVGTMEEIAGLQNLAGMTIEGQPIPGNGVQNHINVIAMNPDDKQVVKQLGDMLGQLMNEVKGFYQRLQEQAQKAQEAQSGGDPKAIAAAQAMMMQAQTKDALAKETHAEKTAQKQITFEQKLKQAQEKHQQTMTVKQAEAQLALAKQRAEAELSLVEKSKSEPTQTT